MTVIRYGGCMMVGLAADTKPSHAGLAGYRFLESDTGFLWYHNGSSWSKIQGYDKAETFQNKTIDAESNSFAGVLQSPFTTTYKRQGFVSVATNPASSLHGCLAGWPTGGTQSLTNDATEGWEATFNSSSSGAIIGYLSNSTYQLVAQRNWNTYMKVRAKASTTTNSRAFIGFSTNNTLPASNTILASNESGVLIGFDTTNANWNVYHNDATSTMVTDSTGDSKDTSWHTFEIIMQANGTTVVKMDAITVNVTTRQPGNTVNVYGNCVMQLAAASSMNWDVKGIIFRSDK